MNRHFYLFFSALGEMMLNHDERVRLLGFRVKHDINQSAFSKGIISRNQLSNIESGKSSTTEKVLYQIYLRLCEYMVVLGDYQRFHFHSLLMYPPYKSLNHAMDLFDTVSDEKLDNQIMNDINLELNQNHFGLFNTFIYERMGDRLIKNKDVENGYLFYLKAYYNLASCNIDEVTLPYITVFIRKVTALAEQKKQYFNVVEMLDHLQSLVERMALKNFNKDFLYTLASAYYAMDLKDKAFRGCKKIVEENLNGSLLTPEILGRSYHLLAILQNENGLSDLAKRNFEKALNLISEHGSTEQLEILKNDVGALGY